MSLSKSELLRAVGFSIFAALAAPVVFVLLIVLYVYVGVPASLVVEWIVSKIGS